MCNRTIRLLPLMFLISSSVFISTIESARAHISGRWTCDFNLEGSGSYPQDLILAVGSNGTVTGQEVVTGTDNVFANITGTLSGSTINMRMQYTSSNYFALVSGAISGNNMSGTWHNDSQKGGFVCSQISSGGNPQPTPTPSDEITPPVNTPGATSKRPTAINLFCNRTIVGFSTADCAVTVGDTGAPPRITPTGAVELLASGGLLPGAASCQLQQTPYSPGVASCKVIFSLPASFPIGVAFPIDATYIGDGNFDGSSTGHTTIKAGCVGDSTNPCSGAVALSFADIPKILKNKISTVFECGNVTTAKSYGTKSYVVPRKGGAIKNVAACIGKVVADAKIGEVLANMDYSQIINLANNISTKDANSDPALKAIKALSDTKIQLQVQKAINNQGEMSNLILKIVKEQSRQKTNAVKNVRSARYKRAARVILLSFASAQINVKNNSLKSINLSLSKPAVKFVSALRKAGLGDIPLQFKLSGKRSSGPKKPFNNAFSTNLFY